MSLLNEALSKEEWLHFCVIVLVKLFLLKSICNFSVEDGDFLFILKMKKSKQVFILPELKRKSSWLGEQYSSLILHLKERFLPFPFPEDPRTTEEKAKRDQWPAALLRITPLNILPPVYSLPS